MAIVLKDRVKETTSTAGTSNFVLGGASSGYQAFSVIGANNFTYYCCFDNATGDWEVGYGQYTTTAGGTLVRTTVLSNSAATTSKIVFAAGPKDVFITYPAEKAIYEEDSGNVLIDGGPITVIGNGVTGYTTFDAALAEMYANVNSFAQLYAQNLNSGSDASTDIVAYNNLGDGSVNFIDMGISSSNYSSALYPIFTPRSGYLYNDGGELIIGSATDDVVFFAGGVGTVNEALRINKTTRALSAGGALSLGGALGVTGAATFGSTVLLNADPSLALQAATKQYVDTAVSTGLHLHQPVLVATTGNLTATYNNGSAGVGATLTNSGTQAALAIDGINMATTNRVLVWQQGTPAQNGVYVVTTVGSGATNWVLTRSSDANSYAPQSDTGLGGGDYFFVQSGTTGSGDSYVCTNSGVIVFGTTAITFAQFSGAITYVGGTNIDVTGQTISLTGTVAATNGGTGTNTVTTGDLLYGSATNTWSKLPAGAGYKSLTMNAGGTQVEWNAVALNQANAVSGSLGATNGGTGQSAYALGDTLYSDATNSVARLAGNTTTTKKFLGQTGTGAASAAPVWEQPAATDITGLAASATTDTTNASNISSGTLPSARLSGSYTGITGVGTLAAGTWNGTAIAAIYGGTGQTSYAVGDLVYANTTTTLAKLADVAVGNALISGGVSSAPSYGKIGLATHVSGTLPVANGGTGATDAAGIRTAAGATTVGGNVFTLTNPSAVTFPRFNADNTVSALDAATFRTAIGAGTGAGTVTGVTGTAPVVSSGGTAPAISMAAASSGVNGYMTGVYATKLDGIAAGAQPGTVTSVSGTGTVSGLTLTGTVTSSGSLTLGGAIGTLNQNTTGSANSVALTAGNEINIGGGLASGTLYVNYNDGGNFINYSFYGGATSLVQLTASQFNGALNGNATTATTASNSNALGGYAPNTSGGANLIVQRDANGYIQNNYFYTSGGGSERNASGMGYFAGFNSSDYYIRSYTPAAVAAAISGQSMNISGNATTATSSPLNSALGNYVWNAADAPNSYGLGISNSFVQASQGFPSYGSVLNCRTYNQSGFQIYGSYAAAYGGSTLRFRVSEAEGGTWGAFRTVLDSSNYTSYAPSLTGSGASGTWGINVTGSSGSTSLATAVQYLPNRTDGTAYPVLWGAAYTSGSGTIAYSCAAVTITSSSGTLTATTVTASSDETLKTNWRDYDPDFVEQLAKVKHGTYDRLDCEVTQDGASAQSLLKVLPKSIWEDAETKKLSINYGGAAMVSTIQLAKRVVEQDERIAKLEALVAKLTEGK